MSEIIKDLLYLGGKDDAEDPAFLQRAKIRAIVCCYSRFDLDGAPSIPLPNIERLAVSIEDSSLEPILDNFPAVHSFITKHISQLHTVLIHCKSGVSRSSTLTIAFIMVYLNMNLRQAFHYVISRRPIVCPNIGFMKQLCDAEVSGYLWQMLDHQYSSIARTSGSEQGDFNEEEDNSSIHNHHQPFSNFEDSAERPLDREERRLDELPSSNRLHTVWDAIKQQQYHTIFSDEDSTDRTSNDNASLLGTPFVQGQLSSRRAKSSNPISETPAASVMTRPISLTRCNNQNSMSSISLSNYVNWYTAHSHIRPSIIP